MSEKTITRVDLAEAIYEEVGLSRKDSADILEMVLDEVSNNLVGKKTVKLSSFGTFTVRSKNERVGRNPKTGVEAPIAPRNVISFKPSQLMKDKINAEG